MNIRIEIYCSFSCHKETPHEQIGEHEFKCLICGAEIQEIYCHVCSKAAGADMPIYHLPPACKSENAPNNSLNTDLHKSQAD